MCEIIKFEIKKTIRLKYVGYMIAALTLSAAVWFFLSTVGGAGSHFSGFAYRALADDLRNSGMSSEEMLTAVRNDKELLSEEDYSGTLYTNNVTEEQWLYRQVIAELEQITGYDAYLEEVQAAYGKINRVSLFDGSGSDTPNAHKTAADFAKMADVDVEFVGSYGITKLFTTDFWTISLLLAAVILVIGLLLMEVEEGGVQLLHSTSKGKASVVYAKYLAGIAILSADLLIGVICRVAAVAAVYGTRGWSACIQSVYGAQSCTWRISIGQTILLWTGLKLLALLAAYSLLFLLALSVRKSVTFYLIGLEGCLAGYGAYAAIDSNSWINVLKWVNPIAFLDTDSLLLDYRNLTFTGVAVSYWLVMVILCLLILLACVLCSGTLFARLKPLGKMSFWNSFQSKLDKCICILTGKYHLIGFENRKWAYYQGGLPICILLILGVSVLSPTVSERIYEKSEIYYKYYVKQVEGTYTQAKMDSLYEERGRLEEIAKDLEEEGNTYTDAAISYYQKELEKQEGLELTIAYGQYLSENGGSFVYEQGYEVLFGIEGSAGAGYVFIYRTLALAVMLLLAGMVWGLERRTRMDVMLHISAFGSRRINHCKYFVIMIIGTLVTICVFFPWVTNVFGVFSTNMILQPACSLKIFEGIPACISILHMLLLFILIHDVYLCLAALLLGPMQKLVSNSLVAQLMIFVLGMLPVVVLYI